MTAASRAGWSWGAAGRLDLITQAGDWDGNGASELLARRSDGTLWDYAGIGDAGFLPSFRVGTGWGAFRMAA